MPGDLTHMFLQYPANPKTGQRITPVVMKHCACFMEPDFLCLQIFSQCTSSLRPNWADPFLAAFSFQKNTRGWRQSQIAGLQTDDFTHSGTGVEQQAQQDKIALAILGSLVN